MMKNSAEIIQNLPTIVKFLITICDKEILKTTRSNFINILENNCIFLVVYYEKIGDSLSLKKMKTTEIISILQILNFTQYKSPKLSESVFSHLAKYHRKSEFTFYEILALWQYQANIEKTNIESRINFLLEKTKQLIKFSDPFFVFFIKLLQKFSWLVFYHIKRILILKIQSFLNKLLMHFSNKLAIK